MLITWYMYSEHFLLLPQLCTQRNCVLKEATKTCQNFFFIHCRYYLARLTHDFWRYTISISIKQLFTMLMTVVNIHIKKYLQGTVQWYSYLVWALFQSDLRIFWDFGSCEGAEACNSIGDNCLGKHGKGFEFSKPSLPPNGECESSVLKEVLNCSCRWF